MSVSGSGAKPGPSPTPVMCDYQPIAGPLYDAFENHILFHLPLHVCWQDAADEAINLTADLHNVGGAE